MPAIMETAHLHVEGSPVRNQVWQVIAIMPCDQRALIINRVAMILAAGKIADFIVLNANPLENISNTRQINKVYLRGQEVDRAGLRAKWQAASGPKTK